MFRSIIKTKLRSYMLVDSEFLAEFESPWGLVDNYTVARVIEIYYERNLPIAKNIALLLCKYKFDVSNVYIYCRSYFLARKTINIDYDKYHDDIIKEYNKLIMLM